MKIVLAVSLACVVGLGCKADPKPVAPHDAAAPAVSSSVTAVASVSASAAMTAPPKLDAGTIAATPSDAGAGACRLLYGPAPQPFRGNGVLYATNDGAFVIFNDGGRPKTTRIASSDAGAFAPLAAEATVATRPPCVVGGAFVFCADRDGNVAKTPLAGGDGAVVAHADKGSRIAATTLAGDRAVLGYLASGGEGTEAFVLVEGGAPTRVSGDASGATAIDLAARGTRAVAMIVDARTATTQVHARALSIAAGAAADKLELGSDAVLFIGAPPVRFTAGVLASSRDGATFALVPLPRGAADFGVATIRVDDPPRVEAAVTWSLYANGLDPAPIAASRGRANMTIARVRPASRDEKSEKLLELGRLDKDGTFTPLAVITGHGSIKDVALDVDAEGAIWLLYTDAEGSWLERRACP